MLLIKLEFKKKFLKKKCQKNYMENRQEFTWKEGGRGGQAC